MVNKKNKPAKKRAKGSGLETKIYQVEDVNPCRCSRCGKTNYRLPKIKYLRDRGCKYCAECGDLFTTYNFDATDEFRGSMGELFHLRGDLIKKGLTALGDSEKDIETNLFKLLNNTIMSFGKFCGDTCFGGKKETLRASRIRYMKRLERYLESEIRKSIPKDQKEGKTKAEINAMVKEVRKQRDERNRVASCPNVISMQEYREKAS